MFLSRLRVHPYNRNTTIFLQTISKLKDDISSQLQKTIGRKERKKHKIDIWNEVKISLNFKTGFNDFMNDLMALRLILLFLRQIK